jgi:pimeloyl-ACP methyl ester carboxylesterase
MNKKNTFIASVSVSILLLIYIGSFASLLASGQLQTIEKKPTPVLLIHGYAEDAAIWKKWEDLLKRDNIPFFTITFKDSDDKCGSALEHAKELEKRVQDIKQQTGADRINIVGHSKGGLDARVYLATGTGDIANLIMIGTPNAGSPAAEISNVCKPAVDDLRPGANATKAEMNPNTKYYTIAGDWNPSLLLNCPQLLGGIGYSQLPKPNDGLVPLSSVESQGYFHNLGHTSNCHSNLLSDKEYQLAKPILVGKQ